MSYYEEFDGIVLFTRKHREKDALVKIFTREHGKAMFFVKNIVAANHPLRSATLPLTSATYLGHINSSGLSFLKDSRNISHYSIFHEDIMINAFATYLVHLADAAVEDRVVATSLFQLLKDCIEALQNGQNPQLVTHLFEIKVLAFFGIFPQWQECVYCHSSQQPFDFSIKHQGMLCQKHWDEDDHRMHIAPKATHIARILASLSSPTQLGNVSISEETTIELRRLMDAVYEEYVGIHLKSKKFIDQMYSWQTQIIKRK